MSPVNNDNSQTFHNILEIYQRCKRNGDWAKVYLETQNGKEFVTLSVCSSAGTSAGAAGVEKTKKKSPSQLRRDRTRHSAYLERRHQAVAAKPATPTPPCKEATIAGTEEVKVEEEKEGKEEEENSDNNSTAGQTNSTEAACDKPAATEKGETTLSEEDIEKLREVINEAYRPLWIHPRLTGNESTGLDKAKETHIDDDNDRIEDAKLWAMNQKQSSMSNEKRS